MGNDHVIVERDCGGGVHVKKPFGHSPVEGRVQDLGRLTKFVQKGPVYSVRVLGWILNKPTTPPLGVFC